MGQSLGFRRHLLSQQVRHQFQSPQLFFEHTPKTQNNTEKQTNNNNKTKQKLGPAATSKKQEVGIRETEKQCSLLP